MPYALVGMAVLLLWLYCLVEVAMTPEHEMRALPKIGWLVIVVLLPTIGSVAWLVAGRPVGPHRPQSNTRYSEYDRPGRYVAQNPDSDEAFLRGLRERADQQRREAQRQELERQREIERRRESGEL